jgi:toxin ParE1/3/4
VKRPRLVLSDAAVADILEQGDWYRRQSGQALAKRWEKAVTSSLLHILKTPGSGQQCTFRREELRNMRRATIAGFSRHLVFYRLDEQEIFILRVLHGARDLENLL